MDVPTMFEPYQAASEIDVIPSYFPIPLLGILPINVYVLKASQPVLVDTGLIPLSDEFIEKLSDVIDISDLRWLWLSHSDLGVYTCSYNLPGYYRFTDKPVQTLQTPPQLL